MRIKVIKKDFDDFHLPVISLSVNFHKVKRKRNEMKLRFDSQKKNKFRTSHVLIRTVFK